MFEAEADPAGILRLDDFPQGRGSGVRLRPVPAAPK